MPAGDSIDQPRRVQLTDTLGQGKLRVIVGDLAPPFVVDDPGDDARIAFVLVDHDLKLALELRLFRVGGPGVGVHPHRRHILDHQETEAVTGFVKKVWLNLDVFSHCGYVSIVPH